MFYSLVMYYVLIKLNTASFFKTPRADNGRKALMPVITLRPAGHNARWRSGKLGKVA